MKVYELTDNAGPLGVYLPGYVGESSAMRDHFALQGIKVEEVSGWSVHRLAIADYAGLFTAEYRDNDPTSADYGSLWYALLVKGMVCAKGLVQEEANKYMDQLSKEFELVEYPLHSGDFHPSNAPEDYWDLKD